MDDEVTAVRRASLRELIADSFRLVHRYGVQFSPTGEG